MFVGGSLFFGLIVLARYLTIDNSDNERNLVSYVAGRWAKDVAYLL